MSRFPVESLDRGIVLELAGDDVLSMNTSSKLPVTALHIERGRQIRLVVQHDVVERGLSFESAVESLAGELGVELETVRLAIAIANDADRGGELLEVSAC